MAIGTTQLASYKHETQLTTKEIATITQNKAK